jgi:hypothetical protein
VARRAVGSGDSAVDSRTVMTARWAGIRPYFRSPLVWFALVNIPFLFIFYDVWNLNTIVYAGGFLYLGLNPYLYGNLIPGGLPIQLLGLFAYQTFEWSQHNPLLTVAVLKVIFAGATAVAGWVLSRIARLEGLAYHRKILYAFIFNPFILFVNDVWVETDVLIILLYVVGFAAVHYGWDRHGELRYLVLGVLCITLAVISYYSVVLLVPTLIIFRNTRRSQLSTLAGFAIAGCLLAIPFVGFGLVGPGILPSLESPNFGISPYSLFSLARPIAPGPLAVIDRGVLIAIASLSVATPWILKRAGVNEAVALLVSYSWAYLLLVNDLEGDNFVLLIGLVFLAVIFARRATLSYRRIFALTLFVLPQLIIVQLLNGVNGVVGLYYWSYYQFHASANLFVLLGGRTTWFALLVAYAALLGGTLAFLVRESILDAPRNRSTWAEAGSATRDRSLGGSAGRAQRRFAVLLTVVVVIATVVPAGISIDTGIRPASISVAGFDPALFIPYGYGDNCTVLPECAYQLSSQTTYQPAGGGAAVEFAGASIPIGLYRNLTDQSYTINVSASVPWGNGNATPGTLDVVNTSSFYAGFANQVVVTNSSILSPSDESNYTTVASGITNVIGGGSDEIFELNGTGVLNYVLSAEALPGERLVFGAELANYTAGQDALWSFIIGSVTYEAYFQNGLFNLEYRTGAESPWLRTAAPIALPLHRWFLTGLQVSSNDSTVSGFINGLDLNAPLGANRSAAVVLNVGKANDTSSSDYEDAFYGNVTNVYAQTVTSLEFRPVGYVWTSRSGGMAVFPIEHYLPVVLSRSGNAFGFELAGHPVPIDPFPAVWIGKLTSSPSSLLITFYRIAISSNLPGPDLLPIVVGFAGVLPLAVALTCLWPELRRIAHGWHRRVPGAESASPRNST